MSDRAFHGKIAEIQIVHLVISSLDSGRGNSTLGGRGNQRRGRGGQWTSGQ